MKSAARIVEIKGVEAKEATHKRYHKWEEHQDALRTRGSAGLSVFDLAPSIKVFVLGDQPGCWAGSAYLEPTCKLT